jgi:hypothetical protein
MKMKDIKTGAWKLEINGRAATGGSYREAKTNLDPPLSEVEEKELDAENTIPSHCSEW